MFRYYWNPSMDNFHGRIYPHLNYSDGHET